jgi:hypothetical protein
MYFALYNLFLCFFLSCPHLSEIIRILIQSRGFFTLTAMKTP